MKGYHFVADTLRDGSPVPADGEWLEREGTLEMCVSGLHWSKHPFDAIQYAPDGVRWLCEIEAGGETVDDADKSVSRRRRIVCRVAAEPLLREFARWCAGQVLHLWDAPQVVRDYLATGDEGLRAAAGAAAWYAARAAAGDAARAAAWAAARAAAWYAARAAAGAAARAAARDAAWAAAWAATWDAARDAQRTHFAEMVKSAFGVR